MFASFFIAAVTAVVALLGGIPILGLIDSALFLAIGFGIKRMSKLAAVCGLILYLVEQAAAFSSGRGSWNIVMLVIITAIYVSAIRATWYHRATAQPEASPSA